jgi:autotransporter-associated beta strand protein
MNPTHLHPKQNPLTPHTLITSIKSVIACAAILTAAAVQAQQNGVWTNDASGLWSAPANWLNGTVADGTGAIADFTLDNANVDTVTMDASHNLGTLLFGNNATVRTNQWVLNASGGSVLTLAGGTPTIAVSNGVSTNTALLSLPIAGTSGLTKVGNGKLVLGSANTYSGATTVSGGVLQLTNAPTIGPVLYLSFNNVNGNVVTNGGSGGRALDGLISGTGVSVTPGAGPNGNATLTVGGGAVNAGYVLVKSSVVPLTISNTSWTVAMWIKTSTAGAVYAYQGDGGWASGNTTFHLNSGSNDLAGVSAGGVRFAQGWQTGTANLTDGNWHLVVMTCTNGVKTNYVDGNIDGWLVIGGTAMMNQWTGNGTGGQFWFGGTPNFGDGDTRLNGQLAEIYVYNRAISQTEAQALMTAAGPTPQAPILPPASAISVAASGKLDLNGVNSATAGLTGVGSVDNTLTNGTAILTVDNSSSPTFSGSITNNLGTLSLVTTGSGALTLSGINGYAGSTWLGSGTLNVNTATALGSGTAGQLYILGGALDNTSGATVTLAANKPEAWLGDFTFNGTTNLNLGSGGVTLSGSGTTRTLTLNSNILTTGAIGGGNSPLGLTLAGAGTLLTSGGSASSIIGDLNVGPNATIENSQDFHSFGLTGTGTVELNGNINKWYFVNITNSSTKVFSGTIQNGPGTPVTSRGLGFNMSGIGTQVLNGNVTLNDTITLNQGKLIFTGSGVTITNPNNGGSVPAIVPSANGFTSVLVLSNNATLMANFTPANVFNSSFNICTTGGRPQSAATVLMYPGCTFNVAKQFTVGGTAGGAGFAAYSQFGGTMTIGGFIACGGTTNGAVYNMSGGSLLMNGSSETIGYGSTTTFGVQNIYGTADFNMTGAGNGVWPGEVGNGTVSLWGNATLAITNDGVQFAHGNAGANSTFNLDGGTLIANFISSVNASGTFNFNGGTLRANLAGQNGSGIFTPGLATSFFDYSGGVTIDDGGNAITFTVPIQATTGFGVSSIPITSSGSNYIDTPIVLISGGSGIGAKASAQIDYGAGTVTNIFITCPGTGYINGDVLTFTVIGGGGSGLVLGTPSFVANTPGNLTKLGAGSLTLSSGNGFAGATKILGGTLNVNSSAFNTPTDFIVTNSGLGIDASSGSSFNAGNVALQNNSSLSLSYGNLSANPGFPALNVTGTLTAPGTGLTIAVNGLGLKPGTFTLVKYTGTALPNLNNFALTLPPGVAATLVNNTGNDSIDLHVTTAPNNLSWEGVSGTAWDIGLTANWRDPLNNEVVYQQYTNGAVIVGDAVRFDDTLTNDFVNPQPTNINLTTSLSSFPVVVDSTLPYSFGGAGSLAGTGFLVKTNSGTLTVGTANSYSGGTFLDQGTLIITNDSALGAASGAITFAGGTLQTFGNLTNSRAINVTAASSLDIPTNLTVQFGGLGSGNGTLTKIDNGTLVIAGTMSNTPAVASGAVKVPGGGRISTIGTIGVGNTASANGVLSISGGTVQANNASGGQFSSSIIAGPTAGAAGSIQMSSGTFTTAEQLGLGSGAGGYGAFTLSGGTVTLGSYLVVGFNNDVAVLNQSSGSITVSSNCPTIAAGGTGSLALANFSGGTLTSVNFTNGNPSGRGGMFVGENGTGFMNVSGTASLTLFGDASLTLGRQAGSSGTVNLLGGTVTAAQVLRGAGSGTLNLNGGTLKAFTNNTAFMSGLSSATIYSGGANINDAGFSINISQPLAAPSGFSVSSIPVSSGGSGYIDTPIVTISGGNGSNATATATVSGGAVTAINITGPGTGYNNGDGLNINITGGGGSGATPGTPTFIAAVGGGLVKSGTGILTLSGANSYSGSTVVGGGQLIVTPAHHVTGAITVTNGATLGVLVNAGGSASIGNLNLGTSATGTNFLLFNLNLGTNPTAPVLQAGTLTSTGTNFVRLSGLISQGVFPILKYSGALAGSGVFNTNVLGPQGLVATLSNDVVDSTLFINVSSAGGIVWTGTNSSAALANVWNIGVTNWTVGPGAVAYTEVAPPGDAIIFTDTGSGTVLLSNILNPATVTISNNAVNYAFQGSGHISGTTGLTKLGSGTATLSYTGDSYAGNTAIANGTLQLGSTTALPSGAAVGNVSISATGTLDLNGNSQTINGLSGSGSVNNSAIANATLTFGTASTGDTTWSGSITNTGSGTLSFTKVGTNTVTFTGASYVANGTASQVNGGTLILTNNAQIISPTAEFWVAQGAGSTSTVIVAGATLVTSNNWLVVGRASASANGTLIVNSGTVQKAGANNIVVGSLGGIGNLVVNGGQVLNNNELWLGEGPTALATLQLNGGLIQAADVRPNNNGGLPTVAPIAFFNGGTLQANTNSANFLQISSEVMSNGLILDDNGFSLNIGGAVLLDGDGNGGGFTKLGSGSVYLDAPNTYTGTTIVSNGLLAGIGSVSGPVLVKSGGSIGAGDTNAPGTLTLNSTTLTIQGKAFMRVSKTGGVPTSDQIAGISTVNYGGSLVISNATLDATPLANGDTFTLFSAGASSGNFASVVGTPGPGLAYSFNPSTGVLSVVTSSGPPPAPTIKKVLFSGGNIIITATNNNGPGGTYALLGTNNIAAPLSTWPVISSGTFDANGNLALTNAVGTGRLFYILRVP